MFNSFKTVLLLGLLTGFLLVIGKQLGGQTGMAIHHVQVQKVGTGGGGLPDFLSQGKKVGGENGGGDQDLAVVPREPHLKGMP